MEQENTNTNQPQGSNNAGVDFKSMPKSAIVIAIICGVGVIGVFLPWYKFANLFGGFFGISGSYTVSGMSTTWGWLAFLNFAGAAAFALFGKQMKLNDKLQKNLPLYTGGAALLCSAIAFIRIISLSYGTAGVGLYISLLAGIALLLVSLNVIKIK